MAAEQQDCNQETSDENGADPGRDPLMHRSVSFRDRIIVLREVGGHTAVTNGGPPRSDQSRGS